jgi:hypothetical protein
MGSSAFLNCFSLSSNSISILCEYFFLLHSARLPPFMVVSSTYLRRAYRAPLMIMRAKIDQNMSRSMDEALKNNSSNIFVSPNIDSP